jgi:chemotaxis protein CheZ
MNERFDKFHKSVLETDEGIRFLAEYKGKIISQMIEKFKDAAGQVDNMDGSSLVTGGIESPDVMDVAQNILEKITSAKEELKAIAEMAKERKPSNNYTAVSDELAAITQDTEDATNSIMDATDEIERITGLVNNGSKTLEDGSKDILAQCGQIIISCSFQDITSQRVQKVVDVLQEIDIQIARIESHLNSPISAGIEENFSKDGFSREQQVEDGLLNGPALPTQQATQEDIDSLFED